MVLTIAFEDNRFNNLAGQVSKIDFVLSCRPGIPNLGYMYPWVYVCLSEGVHLRLAIEGKIYLHVYFQIFVRIPLNIIFKSQYMYIVKYICEKSW